jgi:hypothetical protein
MESIQYRVKEEVRRPLPSFVVMGDVLGWAEDRIAAGMELGKSGAGRPESGERRQLFASVARGRLLGHDGKS